jgi:Bacterial lectin
MATDLLNSLSASPAALTTRPVSPGLAVDPFTGADVTVKPWIFGSSAGTSLGLTARTTAAPSSNGLPGLNTGDADGQGALRLTSAGGNQSSFVIFNDTITSSQGLSITFDFFSYGGNGADGISFFLIDGSQSPTTAGAPGGALGYAARGSGQPGLVGGYLGVGFDEFGNFSSSTDNSPGGTGPAPDSIAVRGSQANGYKFLTGSGTLPTSLDVAGTSRTAARRTARIDLSPTGILKVQVDLNVDGDFLDAGESPTALQGYNVAANNGALPANFKFGFSASTGGSTNIHEIRGLSIGASGQLIGGLAGATYGASQPPVVLSPNLTVSSTTGNVTAATVFITNLKPGDVLSIAGQPITATSGTIGTITWSYDAATGALGFNGSGTPAEYQAALRQVTYRNTNAAPDTEVRNISFRLDSVPGGPSNEIPVQVTIPVVRPTPDLLWRDSASNDVAFWYLQGSTLAQANIAASGLNPAWTVIDSKDFDNDGTADVLWRKTDTGETAIWYMNNNGVFKPNSGGLLSATTRTPIQIVNDGWDLVGATNIDADPALELVWQNRRTDEYAFWNVDYATNTVSSFDYFRDAAGNRLKVGGVNTWTMVGLADFTGDGRSEIVLRYAPLDETAYWRFNIDSATGQLRLANSTFLPKTGFASETLQVRAIADFTGDGRPDILWRKSDQDLTILWTIGVDNAGLLTATPSTLQPATNVSWKIAGAADFVGNAGGPDGTADIVWRNAESDEVAIWSIKNGVFDPANTDFVRRTSGSIAKSDRRTWDIKAVNQFGVGTPI